MAYDENKDVCHKSWQVPGEEGTKLELGVYSYNGGIPKLQIGPRLLEKKDGTVSRLKSGRLSSKEFANLMDLAPKVLKMLASSVKKARK